MPKQFPNFSQGFFLSTTPFYDTHIIMDMDIESDEFKEFLVRLRDTITAHAIAINQREIGSYSQIEIISGNAFSFNINDKSSVKDKIESRVWIETNALPASGTKTIAHGIDFSNDVITSTRIIGAATNSSTNDSIPLPYSSPVLNENIGVRIDNTNIYITVGKNWSSYDISNITIQFIRN